MNIKPISLSNLLFRYKWRISFTFSLVIIESLLGILYPLFIGYAINDLLENSYQGIIHLTLLGAASLLIGTLRRFYDTRVYAGIYCEIAPEMVASEYDKESSTSKITARSSLLIEFVEFLENSMPQVIGSILSLVGILYIVATLNLNIFYACLGLLLLICIIYTATGKLNFKLNANYNEQLEAQVEILESKDINRVKSYYKGLMKWNIKLSDLETVNYLVIWMGVIALFIYAPVAAVSSGILKYGLVFSVLMYVFDYIENVVVFPLYIQQLIRLKEISNRLAE